MIALDLFYFYQLVDPRDNLPFYVGQTIDFESRRQSYLTGRGHGTKLRARLEELNQLGLQPIIQVIERLECTKQEANERESFWIHYLSNQSIVLLNIPHNKQERVQKTVYLPADLAKWLNVFAAQAEMEVSEIVAQALREFREKHK